MPVKLKKEMLFKSCTFFENIKTVFMSTGSFTLADENVTQNRNEIIEEFALQDK